MAVYTEVGDEELDAFVAEYDIGAVLSCKGIAEGVENPNYLLPTETGRFILTLYEKRVAEGDLPFFLGLFMAATDGRYGQSRAGRRRSLPFSTACGRGASGPSTAGKSGGRWRGCIWPVWISA